MMNLEQIIDESLMTRDGLLKYLNDDFRVDPKLIDRVIAHRQKASVVDKSHKRIPHHRYELYFDKSSRSLNIYPSEGLLRLEHIKLEVALLERIYNKKISYISKGIDTTEVDSQTLADNITKKCYGNNIDGILVGSPYNLNFFINLRIRPNFLSKLLKNLDKIDIEKYVNYRLKLIVIEENLLSEKITLSPEELTVFAEGRLPIDSEINEVNQIFQRINDFDLQLTNLQKDNELIQYLKLDYIYYHDMKSGTKNFLKAMDYPETKIYQNDLLPFQIVKYNQKLFINFGWTNPIITSKVIKNLQKNNKINYFYLYGKCGSLSPVYKVGDLVAPSSTKYSGNRIDIHNQVSTEIPRAAFCCVDSPIIETKSWLNEQQRNNIDCVEMELFPLIKSISSETIQNITYYVSDCPGGKYNLSHRFSFLTQRFACVRDILNSLEETDILKGQIGFPIQDIRQENQELLEHVLTQGIDFLHVDVTDGYVGTETNLSETKKLLRKIRLTNPNISVQVHLFVLSKSSLIRIISQLPNTLNQKYYLHLNRDNLSEFKPVDFKKYHIHLAFDVIDILEAKIPDSFLNQAEVIVCLQSREEQKRCQNFDKALLILQKHNPSIVVTLDRSIDLSTIKNIKNRQHLNVICGNYLKEDFESRYKLLKENLNS